MSNDKTNALRTLSDIFTLGKAIASALAADDIERVRDVLSTELATSLAKAAADVKARRKYAP